MTISVAISSPELVGVVNQVSYSRGGMVNFYVFKRQICPRLFCCSHLTKIDQILACNEILCHMALLGVRGFIKNQCSPLKKI